MAHMLKVLHAPHISFDPEVLLSAIVDNSTDAILSKTLDGIITSWNMGAERLFGFTRAEAIGRAITIIIPDDRLHEETEIISRLRRGERIERFETVRRKRDGEPVHIEVTISPVRNAQDEVVGALKIARDIGERLRHAEQQALLVREMQHRIKNLLSIVQGLVSIGARRAKNVTEFVEDLTARIAALATAQQLVLSDAEVQNDSNCATLEAVLRAILTPYFGDGRVGLQRDVTPVGPRALTSLALLFHELATNALKYGGLSGSSGRLSVSTSELDQTVTIIWRESGGMPPQDDRQGFGTDLLRASLRSLDGTLDRQWCDDGLDLTISFLKRKLSL